jgi:hypothetical protein
VNLGRRSFLVCDDYLSNCWVLNLQCTISKLSLSIRLVIWAKYISGTSHSWGVITLSTLKTSLKINCQNHYQVETKYSMHVWQHLRLPLFQWRPHLSYSIKALESEQEDPPSIKFNNIGYGQWSTYFLFSSIVTCFRTNHAKINCKSFRNSALLFLSLSNAVRSNDHRTCWK